MNAKKKRIPGRKKRAEHRHTNGLGFDFSTSLKAKLLFLLQSLKWRMGCFQSTPWKINGRNLQITHLERIERNMIFHPPPSLCSMLIFRGVVSRNIFQYAFLQFPLEKPKKLCSSHFPMPLQKPERTALDLGEMEKVKSSQVANKTEKRPFIHE